MVHPNQNQFSGWVYKQGAIVKTWKRRFMVLNGTELKYYNSSSSMKTEEKGSVQILSVEMSGSIQNGLIVYGKGGRVLKMYTESFVLNKEWFKVITRVICTLESHSVITEPQNNQRVEINNAFDSMIRVSFDSTRTSTEPEIRYSGWLVKQGGRVKNWKRRYFLLRGDVLSYFDTESTGAVAKGFGHVIHSQILSSKTNCLEIQFRNGRTLHVIAASQKLVQEWLHILCDVATAHSRDDSKLANVQHFGDSQHQPDKSETLAYYATRVLPCQIESDRVGYWI